MAEKTVATLLDLSLETGPELLGAAEKSGINLSETIIAGAAAGKAGAAATEEIAVAVSNTIKIARFASKALGALGVIVTVVVVAIDAIEGKKQKEKLEKYCLNPYLLLNLLTFSQDLLLSTPRCGSTRNMWRFCYVVQAAL